MDELIWQGDLKAIQNAVINGTISISNGLMEYALQVSCLRAYPNYEIFVFLVSEGVSTNFEVSDGVKLIDAARERIKRDGGDQLIPFFSIIEKDSLRDRLGQNLVKRPHLKKGVGI